MNLGGSIERVLNGLQVVSLPWIRPRIVRAFWHDPEAYTQGLAFYRGTLYESTGLENASSLRVVDACDGRVRERHDVPGEFVEGIGILRERLYQLTWRTGRVFIYDLRPLRRVGEARIAHEGWGLASDGSQLWATDGSEVIRRYDSEMLMLAEVRVRSRGYAFRHLNDIEMAKGRLYANIWYSRFLAEVDVSLGRVVRMVDCSELVRLAGAQNREDVMNGIAFNADADTFFVTGKRWEKYFEIQLPD